jgi:hypothetical protein
LKAVLFGVGAGKTALTPRRLIVFWGDIAEFERVRLGLRDGGFE